MKLVDTKDNKFVDANPATLEPGTPIPASSMNSIQDEIANVITGYGLTIDESNDAQMKAALDKNFAPINSPTLTGIPLTSNPDGTINNQIATVDYVNQKALQATVGFTPVQQSGGDNQGANKIYIGADKTDSNQVRVQVDQTDLGKIVFQEENNDTYGIKQIGYNHTSDFISTLDSNNNYHNIHTADYIDAKQWISSLPDGNNLKVSDIIWNSSSSLPALYYGSDNSVAYLATEAWANTTFQPAGDYATNTALANGLATKQAAGNYARTDAINTFSNDQNFSGYLNVSDGKALVTNSLDNSIRAFRYVDNNGAATTDLDRASDGTNLSWFRLYQDGMLRTNIGDVVFNHRDIDYGPINGGYYTRVGNVITQSFTVSANDGTTVNLPITMANTNYIISLITVGGGINVNTTEVVRYLSGSKTQSSFVFLKNFVSWNSVSGETKVIPVDIIIIGVI